MAQSTVPLYFSDSKPYNCVLITSIGVLPKTEPAPAIAPDNKVFIVNGALGITVSVSFMQSS